MTAVWKNRIVGTGEVPPQDLTPNPANWRQHPKPQRKALASAISSIGWVQQVIVNRRTGHLVDGHLRCLLALDHGERAIPVLYVDLSEVEEAQVLATLDPIGAMAEADTARLAELLSQVETSDRNVQQLLASIARDFGVPNALPEPGATEPDAVPGIAPLAVTQLDDLWLLGEQRLLCADSAKPEAVIRASQGEPLRWMETDPPYGVDYIGGTGDALTIENDSAARIPDLLDAVFRNVDALLIDGAPIYVAHPAGPLALVFAAAFIRYFRLHQDLVWVKDDFVLGHSDYHFQHEPIYYGWKGTNRPWFAGRDQSSVFMIPRPRRNSDHPTSKPIALFEAFLANSTAPGDLGIDPFCGSGTTLLAAHRFKRRCAAIEIDPLYADVTVRRWQDFSGLDAVHEGTGLTFTELEEARRGR